MIEVYYKTAVIENGRQIETHDSQPQRCETEADAAIAIAAIETKHMAEIKRGRVVVIKRVLPPESTALQGENIATLSTKLEAQDAVLKAQQAVIDKLMAEREPKAKSKKAEAGEA